MDRTLKHTTLIEASIELHAGDKVLLWMEKIAENCIFEWMGPWEVVDFNTKRKLVYIRDKVLGPARPCTVKQVKRYIDTERTSHSLITDLAEKNKRLDQYDEGEVFLSKVVDYNVPRASSREIQDAKKKKNGNLLEGLAFKVILKGDITRDANVLTGSFVLAITSTTDVQTTFKASDVTGGHLDWYKHIMIHNSTSIQPQSAPMLLALAAIFNFDVSTCDVKQAYL